MPHYVSLSSLETPSKNHAITSVTRPGDDYLGAGLGPRLSSYAAGVRRENSIENPWLTARLPELTTNTVPRQGIHMNFLPLSYPCDWGSLALRVQAVWGPIQKLIRQCVAESGVVHRSGWYSN